MSCDNEFDENDSQPSPGNEVNGLPLSNGGTLIEGLAAWDDIPDMDSFRETSTLNQNETLEDVPPLYKDSISSGMRNMRTVPFWIAGAERVGACAVRTSGGGHRCRVTMTTSVGLRVSVTGRGSPIQVVTPLEQA